MMLLEALAYLEKKMPNTLQIKIQRGKNSVLSGTWKDISPWYLILVRRKTKHGKKSVPNTVHNSILLEKIQNVSSSSVVLYETRDWSEQDRQLRTMGAGRKKKRQLKIKKSGGKKSCLDFQLARSVHLPA